MSFLKPCLFVLIADLDTRHPFIKCALPHCLSGQANRIFEQRGFFACMQDEFRSKHYGRCQFIREHTTKLSI